MKHVHLIKAERSKETYHDDSYVLHYEGEHSKGGKTLNFDITLTQAMTNVGGFNATIDFGECNAPSIQEALTKLGEWCGRAAQTLAERGESEMNIPT